MPISYQSDFSHEEVQLENTQQLIDSNIAYLEKETVKSADALKELYKQYSMGETAAYAELPAASFIYEANKSALAENEKAKTSPYFGKTIFSYLEKGEDEVMYFGKKGITDATVEVNKKAAVVDWRAPVADVYYSSKLGNTSYNAPKGDIKVDLKLKTTIMIKNSKLVSLYDAEAVTKDELLCDYLSQNKDVVLNDIVATIQDDQNRIIRKPLAKNIVVQGVAGSGKTTVALHRIAFLLYNYKDDIQFGNICLIAANKLFLRYITGMLPDLDVPAIKQKTLGELLCGAIRDYLPKFPQAPPDDIGIPATCYDNDSYIERFEAFALELRDKIFCKEKISFLDFELLSISEIEETAQVESISLRQRARILDKRIYDRLLLQKERIIGYICSLKGRETVEKAAKEAFNLGNTAILEDTLSRKYLTFCAKYKNHFDDRIKGRNPKTLFTEFTGIPFKSPDINALACFLRILVYMFGTEFSSDIRHIVIDEAQDFNITAYYALKGLYPKATFTVVGDIMQNIHDDGLQSWDSLIDKVFGQKADFNSLTKSYRNTIEISEFAVSAIKSLTGNTIDIEPIIRHGEAVKVMPYVTPPERLQALKEVIASFDKTGYNLNAVICKTDEEAQKLYASFKKKGGISLLDPEKGMLQSGTYIVSLPNVKGLEFDGIVVWDFDSYKKEDAKRLYVALTRALHKLCVFSNKKLDFFELCKSEAI